MAYRIGFLSPGAENRYTHRIAAFRQSLQELGYRVGADTVIEARYAEGCKDRLFALAEELVGLKSDIIVTHGDATLAADRAARASSRPVPIVFAVAADPIGSGFVASLARPGGNITGLSDLHSDLVAKRLALLKEVDPTITRIAVLWSHVSTFTRTQLRMLEAAAPRMGITLVPVRFGIHDDVDPAFAALRREKPDALNVLGYPFTGIYRERIIDFVRANRLPAIFTSPRWLAAGGLISYGVDFTDMYRRAAVIVDKILKGAKPATLPVEQPTRFYPRLNRKATRSLGITFPLSVLLRAHEVIE
jgi:putative ABC transport system substrate-binding protein